MNQHHPPQSHQSPPLVLRDMGWWGWRQVLFVNFIGGIMSFAALAAWAAGIFLCFAAARQRSFTLFAMAILCFVAMALPFIWMGVTFSNFYVRQLVTKRVPGREGACCEVVAQITFSPRLRDGLLGALEDADDIGFLWIYPERIEFEGATVSLNLPFSNIIRIEPNPPSARAVWLGGERFTALSLNLSKFSSIQFAQRSSTTFIESQRLAALMVDTAVVAFHAVSGKHITTTGPQT